MLNVSLLGEQALTDDETGEVRTRSSRAIALIAFLIAHAGSPQTRQRISLLFWPDSTDGQALTNLRRELHHLRHVLADEPSLVVSSTDLCWRDTDSSRVDLRAFALDRAASLAAAARGDSEELIAHGAAAIAEYRGEFLPGAYDDWVLEVRAELERQCVDLCVLVGEAQAQLGDLPGAAATARRRIALQPLEEEGYRTLMQLQADLGDRASAVSTYHHCASVLERELGVIPDQATRATLQRLLARDEDERPITIEPSPGRFGFAAAALFGRSTEVALLQDLWRTAATGRPSLAMVHGGAGVGKTRLVTDVAELARQQGAVVATAQCFGTSGRLALAPVADWLRTPVVQSANATLDPIWRTEVERLTPSGNGRGQRDAGARPMADAWQRHRFFEGLARALIGVERPMVLVLDNVQWCDQETLAFITFLLGLTPTNPVLVAATRRDDNLDDDLELAEWTVRMRATGLLTELELAPLNVRDTARLAAGIAGRPLSPDEADMLHATTGGFPLYVIEAVRATAAVPDAAQPMGDFTTVLQNRLAQATPTARAIAGLAAAVGRDFTLDLLTEASDLEADNVVRAVDELWRRRIIHELRDGYDFSHDLLRETAYAQVSPPQRWLLHRRLAQSLELLNAHDMDAISGQLAQQYARAGRPAKAVEYYGRAAGLATDIFAHVEAIRLSEEALSIVRAQPPGREWERQELAILETMAAPLTAKYGYASPELQDALERTITLAEKLSRKDSTITALFGLWTSRIVQGRMLDSQETGIRVMALVEPGSEHSGSAHFAFAGTCLILGRPAEALVNFEVAAELTKGASVWPLGNRPDVHGRAWTAHAHWLLGDDAKARATCVEALELARARNEPYSLAVALAYAGITWQMCGELLELRQTVDELGELCARYGFAYYREWGLVLDGWCRGDEAGIGLARQGIDNLKAAGAFARMPYWLALYADILARGDQPEAARATLDAALAAGQAHEDLWWLPEVIRMRAAYDEEAAAIRRLHAAAQMAASHGSHALLRRCQGDLAKQGVRSAPSVLPSS